LTRAPIFWRDFADCLRKFVDELQRGLQGDITKGNIAFIQRSHRKEVKIEKSAFPYVSFTAVPDFGTGKVTMSLTNVNPRLTGSASGVHIACRFEVQNDNTLMLRINGHAYVSPEEAAQCIMEKAFTV